MSVVLLTDTAPFPTGARILHTYASGVRLVEVPDAPDAEEGAGPAPEARHGVRLAARGDAVGAARRLLRGREEPGRPAEPLSRLLHRGRLLGYVELLGPPDATVTAMLRAAGLTIVGFQPVDTYLCRGTPEQFDAAAALPVVRGVLPLTGALKPLPRLPEDGEVDLVVSLVADPDAPAAEVLEPLRAVAGVHVDDASAEPTATGLRVRVRADATAGSVIADLPTVLAVERFHPRTTEDEVANLVLTGGVDRTAGPRGSYLDWLTGHGLTGAGVTVGVVDDGVDATHPAFAGRIVSRDSGAGSHGTMVAGQLAGRYLDELDAAGFVYGLGVAPGAELVSQDSAGTITALTAETVRTTGPGGHPATIQNNSWGTVTRTPMDYGSDEATLDARVRNAVAGADPALPLTICFSAGNKGDLGLTRPKAAKNVIVTGNSENLRPDVGGTAADDIDAVVTGLEGSSRGNCGDGRVRPDVVAPGQWSAGANFGVAAGDPRFVSDRIRYGNGTSAASPKVAGACAVLTEWWRRLTDGATPSPAMLRALLVNQAVDTGFGGPVPNPYQGWGRVDVGAVLAAGRSRVYVDQTILVADPGEHVTVDLEAADPAAPVRVTLVWTDPPGSVGSGTVEVPAVVNRVGLRVDVGPVAYYGNVLDQGWSIRDLAPEESRHGTDNVQNVRLPGGATAGGFRVVVSALSVAVDCLTGGTATPRQDFALVVDNVRPAAGAIPPDGVLILDEPRRRPAPEEGPARPAAPLIMMRPGPNARMRQDLPDRGEIPPRPARRPSRMDVVRAEPFPTVVVPPGRIVVQDGIVVRPTVPPAPNVVPLAVGDTVLLVDVTDRRIHHRLAAPALVSAAVTVTRAPGELQITGGTVSLTVRCHALPDPALWQAQAIGWTAALETAGLGTGPWSFLPLQIRSLGGELLLPAGYGDGAVTVTASPESGLMTFLAGLTAAGARDWQRAIEERRPDTVTGTCSVAASVLAAAGDGSVITVRDEVLGAALGTLLTGTGPDLLRLLDPRSTVDARILVTPYEGIETLLVEARGRGRDTVVSNTFGPAGGELVYAVSGEDLSQEAVDWTATLTFGSRSWPALRLSGELSTAAGSWSTLVRPRACIAARTLFATLHDASGAVVAGHEGDVVTGEIRHEAPFLDGGALVSTFQLVAGELTTVEYPTPPGAGPVTTRLTVRTARGGQVAMEVRELGDRDTMIGVRVGPDAAIRITTNTDPVPEEGGRHPALDLALPNRVPEEGVRPEIHGPATWPLSSTPPDFDVFAGDHPFWMVELGTDPAELEPGAGHGPEAYWMGGDEEGVFATGGSWTVPQDVWDRLGPSGTLCYRLFTSERDDGFVDWTVSIDDADLAAVPMVRVESGGSSATGGADVAALCGYLGLSATEFEDGESRYFSRLGELLAFHGVVSSASDIDRSTFRDAVRTFQGERGLAVDGIPGEDTAWELNLAWAQARRLDVVSVPMDLWTPPGVPRHVEADHGFSTTSVRSDVADTVAALRAELGAAGVLMTSAGGARPLDATVTQGRSSTSIHYSAAAFDLATVSGMVGSATDRLYVVTRDGARWRVWARSDDGVDRTLDAVEWSGGTVSTRSVTGRFLDVTAAAERYGLRPIGPRSTFPADYLSAEWWHFQDEGVLVPWISQFGAEILSLARYSVNDLQARPAMWAARTRLFQRRRNGWW